MTFNRIMIMGYLGRDPELHQTANGKTYCEMPLATHEKWKEENTTIWFRVILWGGLAEIAKRYLVKGRLVFVEGNLRTREWQDKQGQTRITLEVQGNGLQLIGNGNNLAEANDQEEPATQSRPAVAVRGARIKTNER